VHAEDKRMNILFKAASDDLLVGTQGTLPAPKGNLRAAVAGQHVLLLENVHSELIAPSVREAVLADAGDSLQFLGLRDPTAASGLFGRGSTPLILKRDRNP
jgi:hypothetical protein